MYTHEDTLTQDNTWLHDNHRKTGLFCRGRISLSQHELFIPARSLVTGRLLRHTHSTVLRAQWTILRVQQGLWARRTTGRRLLPHTFLLSSRKWS